MDWRKYKSQILVIATILGLIIYGRFVKSQENSIIETPTMTTADVTDKPEDKNSVLMCHITGEVNQPGVYEFQEGSRLKDIVALAGGLTENAYTDELNLSMRITDEMKIKIRNIHEIDTKEVSNSDTGSLDAPNQNLININTAEKSQLMELQGIGEKKAEQIIEIRQQAPFQKVEDLMNVPGIGPKTFENLKNDITVN